jgi:ATP phosphoribosyltransferase regulatory subunit HisZ
MILRRLGGGDEAYYTRVTFRLYVEEADNPACAGQALLTKIAL